ncbi:MAG: flippase [Candidatus Nanosalina sp.]
MDKYQRLSKIREGISVVLIGTLFSSLIGILFHPVMARLLGTADYGKLAIALSVFSPLSHLSLFGMRESVRKFIAEFKQERDEIASFAVSFLLFVGTVPLVAAVLLSFSGIDLGLFGSEVRSMVIMVLPALFTTNIFKGLRAVLYGTYSESRAELLRIIQRSLFLAGSIFLVVTGYGVGGVILSLTLAPLITAVPAYIFVRKNVQLSFSKSFVLDNSRKESIMVYSLFTVLMVIFTQIHLNVDIILLGFFSGNEAAGIYKAAVVAANFLFMVPAILQNISLHNLSDVYSNEEEQDLREYAGYFLRYSLAALTILSLGLFVLAEPFLSLYYGNKFVQAALSLKVLIFGAFMAGISKILMPALQAAGEIKKSVGAAAVAAVLNILLNLFMIPRYGIEGAAAATGFSYAVMLVIYGLIFWREIGGIDLHGYIIKLFFCSLLTFVCLSLVEAAIPSALLKIITVPPLGLAMFLVLILKTGCLDIENLRKWFYNSSFR